MAKTDYSLKMILDEEEFEKIKSHCINHARQNQRNKYINLKKFAVHFV